MIISKKVNYIVQVPWTPTLTERSDLLAENFGIRITIDMDVILGGITVGMKHCLVLWW
jgi:hypothetical protein